MLRRRMLASILECGSRTFELLRKILRHLLLVLLLVLLLLVVLVLLFVCILFPVASLKKK